MGTMSVPSRTLCLTLEVINGNICFLDGKRRVVRKSVGSGIPGSGKPSD